MRAVRETGRPFFRGSPIYVSRKFVAADATAAHRRFMQNERISLIEQADQAMGRGEFVQAASLLEMAAQRGHDAVILLRLASVRRAMGDISGAASVAMAGLQLAPRNFLMALLLGSLREATGAVHGAVRAYRAALEYAPERVPFQPALEAQLQHARDQVDAENEWQQQLLSWDNEETKSQLDVGEWKRMRGFRANILEYLDSDPLAAPKFLIPGLPARTFFEPEEFPQLDGLVAHTDAILAEFLAVVGDKTGRFARHMAGLHGVEASSEATGQWSMIPLVRNGRRVDEFASCCPTTMKAIERLDLPKLGMISPSVYFSTLEPGTHIPAHTGITNARAIAHLPLVVPDGCRFRVGEEIREWEVGKVMVFDDMTMHEAWNEGTGLRAVLIVDLWRPELSAAERNVVEELMALNLPDAQAVSST